MPKGKFPFLSRSNAPLRSLFDRKCNDAVKHLFLKAKDPNSDHSVDNTNGNHSQVIGLELYKNES